jgi:vitamin B12 transporter
VERFGNFADQFVGNPQLNPEKSKGFEVGMEQRLLGGRLLAEAAYFNETLEDEINGFVFDLATFSLTAQNMDGRSKRKGVELQIAAALSENFQARASYTYTDSTQPNAQGQPTREVRRPTHMAAINLNYALLNARANVNLNASYTGSQTDEIFPPPFFEPTRVPLGDYTLVDLAASYALTEKATLYARVENLMNESYSDIFGFAAPGRGAYAGIKLQL